mgnify:CR=1 FL=1
MTDLDPLLDPTGRIEPVQNAIIGGRSLWEDARARLFRNRAAVVSMWILGFLILFAVVGPFVWVHKYSTISDLRTIAPVFQMNKSPFAGRNALPPVLHIHRVKWRHMKSLFKIKCLFRTRLRPRI